MKKRLLSSEIFKRVLSMTIVLVMLLGMVPVGHVHAASGTTVYLVPNANWHVDNARFAVYYWNDSGNAWVDMTDADGDGYYEATIPAGYSNIIFCRMNPGTTENNWDNKWNQTSDLTVPTDGTNCYTVAEGAWDNGGGSWSTYTPAGEETEETEPAPAGTYYVAGDSALCGSNWSNNDAANQMTWNGVTCCFEKVYTNVAAGTYNLKVTDGTWDNCWGDNGNNYTFVVSAVCDVTVSFDPGTQTVSVTGDSVAKETGLEITSMHAVGNGSGNWLNGKNWDVSANAMTEVSGNVYEITFKNVAAGSYEYKFAANASWTHSWGGGGAAGEAVYNGQNIALSLTEASDVTLKIDMTGYNHEAKTGATYSVTITAAEGGSETEPTEPEEEPEIPEGATTVTLHFMKPDGWGSNINAYLWSTSGGAVSGYEAYNSWPGKAVSDTDGDGWYDLAVASEDAFNFIFNDGSNQTNDLSTGEVNGNKELWVVGNDVFEEQPDYTVVIHFQNSDNWSQVNAYVWDPFNNNAAIPGYESYNTWPGATIEENTNNPGWYDLTITKDNSTGFNFIFNNNSGSQTSDLWTGDLSFHTELWVVGDTVDSTAPTGWSNPELKVYVPGTFPGPSWDAASNQMTYDAELGLYVYTFENVIKGTYEYKIAINGSWNENYGANGEANGDNIKVVVPSEQDVTIWYNASSHRSVCSVYYDMDADITLSGTGVAEGTKLTDPDLTGTFSVTVNLSAGTYSDLKVTYNGVDYSFTEFTMETGKDVTFWFDPSTGLAYHNGSDVKVETDKIYYTTKDLDYKDPFGAVAAGEEVTFSIDTGVDATAVNLIVKGYPATGMTKDGEAVDGVQHWKCTTTFDSIGEYEYYFAITNGSDMVFYCDDIWNNYYKTGDYGQGGIGNADDIFAYDLVVYEAGFETPDWMKNAVIYQIFPDRFFDGDESNNLAQTWARGTVDYEYVTDWYMLPENPEQESLNPDEYPETAFSGDGEYSNEIYGGDLEGIIDRIDYLKALGVNVIYLNPVFWSISNHRYDAVSYTEIDPILGTLGDFEELVAVAEANDMHIILDGVFNHVSDDSVYFDRYYKFLPDAAEKYDGKVGAYPYWAFVYDYMAEQGVDQETAETAAVEYFTAEYGITDYSYTEWFAVSSTPMTGAADTIGLRAGKPVYSYEGWWGYDSMPVIYSTNGSEYQTGNWAEEIIYNEEGTAVTQYWISKGSNGWRLDVANEVSDETWQNFRDSVKALDSDAVIIGEIWADATQYLMGDMYDSVMNYVFRDAVAGFARGYLINRDNKSEKYDDDLTADEAMTILEILRERYPEEAFYAMMNLVASHDTSRILSYLDDVEDDRYQKDVDSAFPTYEGTSEEAKQLQYVVSFLQFTYAGAPTIYYGDEIGMVGGDDPDDRRAFTWGKGNQDIVEWYAEMAAIRAAYPALRTGSVEPFSSGNDDVMGFVRADADNTLVVLANRAATAQTVAYEGTWVDLISGETFTDNVTIDAYRGVILVTEDEVQEITVDTEGLAPAYDESYIVAERDPNGHSHEYTGEVTTEAGCETDGEMTYTCACGDSYTKEIPATGHNVVLKESEAATCELNGYEYYACEYCGGQEYTIIQEATGHSYVDGVCEACGAEDPDADDSDSGSIFDKLKEWLGSIFDPKPEEPSEPSEPTEPDEPTEPEKPGKPGWGGWFDWWPFW